MSEIEDQLGLRPLKALTLAERVIDPEQIPWVPYTETIWVKPLRLNRKTGQWANITKVVGGGQIEDALFRHPALADAAVVGAPDRYHGEIPVAYVVLRPGAELDEDAVITHCRAELAAYKAPRRVVFVTEIPKTPTGKTLRRELRERERTGERAAG